MVSLYDEKKLIQISSAVLAFLVITFFIWGYFAPLNSVVVAMGKLTVHGQNQKVQHLEGGIVKEILVNNGDRVQQGDLLLILDSTQDMAQLNISKIKKTELLVKKIRLEAQRDESDQLDFPKYLLTLDSKERIEALQSSEKSIFNSKAKFLKSQKEILQQKINKNLEKRIGLDKLLISKKSYKTSLKKEIDELEILFKEQLVDNIKLRELQRNYMSLDGEISQLFADKASLEVDIVEIKEQMLMDKNEFLNAVLEELKETQSSISDLDEKIVALQDKVTRSKIYAPSDGVVQNKLIFTKSAVVKPGENIMSIVPKKRKLFVEGEVLTTDIDQLKDKQLCDIRFSAFNTQNVFSVEGKLNYISADRITQEDKEYYRVYIDITNNGKKQVVENGFDLKAGMPAEVMIKTGSRTLLSYLTKPFINFSARAFNED